MRTQAPPIEISRGEVLYLQQPEQRCAAIHELLGRLRPSIDGDVYWVDAADHAAPAALAEHADHPRRLESIRIARAFTAYQHHAIVRELPGLLDSAPGLIVLPAAARLYRDDDVPAYDTTRYLRATVRILEAVADTFDVPILYSTVAEMPPDMHTPFQQAADRTIECERTGLGYRFEGPDVQTTVYWSEGWWQTTIPYWVELCGAAGTGGVEQLADQGVALPMGV